MEFFSNVERTMLRDFGGFLRDEEDEEEDSYLSISFFLRNEQEQKGKLVNLLFMLILLWYEYLAEATFHCEVDD